MSQKISSHPKVLFVTYEYQDRVSGGIGRVINGLVEALEGQLAFDVFLLEWRNLTMTFSGSLYSGKGKAKEKYWRKQYKVLHSLIRKQSYDIVHFLHCGEAPYEAIQYLRAQNTTAKLVYSCHSLAKHEQHIRKNASKELFWEEYILQHVDYIHVLNQSSVQWLTEQYPEVVSTKPIVIIPNGIKPAAYVEISQEFKDEWSEPLQTQENTIILCMSRWSHGKGLELLLEAVPLVVKHSPHVRFVVVGRKQNSWENSVNAYVQNIDKQVAQLSPWVVPMGWVDDLQRNTLLSLADICVMPSEMEYFPYSILEPMAAQVPIISSQLSCVEELLQDGEECLFYPIKDTHKLAEHLITLMTKASLRQSIATKAFLKIEEQYHWLKVARLYQEFYQRLHIGYGVEKIMNQTVVNSSNL